MPPPPKPTRRRARTLATTLAVLTGCSVAPFEGAAVSPTGLQLPASYVRTPSCADCEGVRTQLDLWPDGAFHRRRVYVGKLGREMPTSLAWRGPDALEAVYLR